MSERSQNAIFFSSVPGKKFSSGLFVRQMSTILFTAINDCMFDL